MKTIPKIYGFNKSSEAGPDNFAPSIFLGGCNMRCPYCMNSKLVLNPSQLPEIDFNTVKEHIKINNCKWVNISGGEPTLANPDHLNELLWQLKDCGCNIALSTNGTRPETLKAILSNVNYITMDIKVGKSKYREIMAGVVSYEDELDPFMETITSLYTMRFFKKERVDLDYEVRTTLYRDLVTDGTIREIGSYLLRQEKWVLQPFRHTKAMIGERAYSVEPYTEEEVDALLEIAKLYSDEVKIRHV